MTSRQRFLNRIHGKPVDRPPFFPDLSMWYQYQRNAGKLPAHLFAPGELIPPGDPVHALTGTFPERYRSLDLLSLHREIGCGLPVHGYGSFYRMETEGFTVEVEKGPGSETKTIRTPKGVLRETRRQAENHSWATQEHLVKGPDDYPALEFMVTHTRPTADYGKIQSMLAVVGDLGYINLIVGRSPMGKFMIDYMGLENLTYAMADDPAGFDRIFNVVRDHDRAVWALCAKAPGQIGFIADNMDEFLYSPILYRKYCLPVYQEITMTLHAGGKKVLAHMDGRLRNILPMVKDTGIDVLDGCTPAPMNDFSVKELHDALGSGQYAYCGIPAPFLVQNKKLSEILDFGRMILDTLKERAILNIGDIMPEHGDIETIRAISEMAAKEYS